MLCKWLIQCVHRLRRWCKLVIQGMQHTREAVNYPPICIVRWLKSNLFATKRDGKLILLVLHLLISNLSIRRYSLCFCCCKKEMSTFSKLSIKSVGSVTVLKVLFTSFHPEIHPKPVQSSPDVASQCFIRFWCVILNNENKSFGDDDINEHDDDDDGND